jgi:hypothetical protein
MRLKSKDGCPMLERTSRFILELFPYLSSALIAAVLVPAFLYSQAHGLKAAVTPALPGGNENSLEIRRDHAALAPQQTRGMNAAPPPLAEYKLAYR